MRTKRPRSSVHVLGVMYRKTMDSLDEQYYNACDGLCYAETQEEANYSIEVFRELYEYQHAGATMELASMYETGKWLEQDEEKSLLLFKEALNLECFYAGISIANIFFRRNDIKNGLIFLEKAADNNVNLALTMLGQMYEKGDRVIKDKVRALKYYERAAANDDSEGKIGKFRLRVNIRNENSEDRKWAWPAK